MSLVDVCARFVSLKSRKIRQDNIGTLLAYPARTYDLSINILSLHLDIKGNKVCISTPGSGLQRKGSSSTPVPPRPPGVIVTRFERPLNLCSPVNRRKGRWDWKWFIRPKCCRLFPETHERYLHRLFVEYWRT